MDQPRTQWQFFAIEIEQEYATESLVADNECKLVLNIACAEIVDSSWAESDFEIRHNVQPLDHFQNQSESIALSDRVSCAVIMTNA
jgi:hypothetical protein